MLKMKFRSRIADKKSKESKNPSKFVETKSENLTQFVEPQNAIPQKAPQNVEERLKNVETQLEKVRMQAQNVETTGQDTQNPSNPVETVPQNVETLTPNVAAIPDEPAQTRTAAEEGICADDAERFFAAFPAAKSNVSELAAALSSSTGLDYTHMVECYAKILAATAERAQKTVTDDALLFEAASGNERVRRRIVEAYLATRPAAPGFMPRASGGAIPILPPSRPKSLTEASDLARKFFR